jgi:hypothetical protein
MGKTSDDVKQELQERLCRACGTKYKYPVPKSLATRFYCELCAELPAGVRAVIERLHKQVKSLSAEVAKLRKQASNSS